MNPYCCSFYHCSRFIYTLYSQEEIPSYPPYWTGKKYVFSATTRKSITLFGKKKNNFQMDDQNISVYVLAFLASGVNKVERWLQMDKEMY